MAPLWPKSVRATGRADMAAVLFSQMDPPPGHANDLDRWYETEHIPARMAVQGFTGAARYRNVEGEPAHLALYELADLSVLASTDYGQLKEAPSDTTAEMHATVTSASRYTLETVADTGAVGGAAPYLLVVALAVPAEHEAEFNEWYGSEHVALLMQVPGWRRIRQFRAVESRGGGALTHFALNELQTLDALSAPQREAARATTWTARLNEQHAWFRSNVRWTYSLISAHVPEFREAEHA